MINLINWSDGNFEECIIPYSSGVEISINVPMPLEKRTYIVFKIRAKDIFDTVSDWTTLEIMIPRNKVYANWFLRLLDHFP